MVGWLYFWRTDAHEGVVSGPKRKRAIGQDIQGLGHADRRHLARLARAAARQKPQLSRFSLQHAQVAIWHFSKRQGPSFAERVI